MRLTFFMFTDLRTGAGTEQVALELIKNKPKDIEITIIETDLLDKKRISREEIDRITNGCKIIKIPHPKSYKPKRGSTFFRIINLIVELTVKPTVRLYHSLPETTIQEIHNTDAVYFFNNSYAVFYRGFKNKIILIGTCHTGCPTVPQIEEKMGRLKNPLRKIAIEMSHNIYTSSLNGIHLFHGQKECLDLWPYKYKMVLANGVDTSKYYPEFSKNINVVKFLFVARLESSKGVLILEEILKRLDDQYAYEFHIVGGGSMQSLVQELSKINRKVIYHGIMDEADLEKLYRECDVFVYPTLGDSFALVVLQALSSGLYVLTSENLRRIYDNFLHKNLEYLHPEPSVFLNRMIEIIKNKESIIFDKKMIFDYVKENYDWKVISAKFYENMRNFYDYSLKLPPN